MVVIVSVSYFRTFTVHVGSKSDFFLTFLFGFFVVYQLHFFQEIWFTAYVDVVSTELHAGFDHLLTIKPEVTKEIKVRCNSGRDQGGERGIRFDL